MHNTFQKNMCFSSGVNKTCHHFQRNSKTKTAALRGDGTSCFNGDEERQISFETHLASFIFIVFKKDFPW